MKKTMLCLVLLILFAYVNDLHAQSITATWPLTSTTTVNGTASTEAIAAGVQVRGPAFSVSPAYNTRTISGAGSVSSQTVTVNPGPSSTSSATAHAGGGYVQFAVTAQQGYGFIPTGLSLYMGSGNANSNGTSIEYSLDSSFTAPVVLAAPSGATSFPTTNLLFPFSFTFPDVTVLAGQTFYLRIYAWNGNSTAVRYLLLSNVVVTGTVATPKPLVSTTSVSNLTPTTATVTGNVTSDNGSAVTERGFVYGVNSNPTVTDSKATDTAGGTGVYSVMLTGLTEYSSYHVRAYAINSQGVAYGEDLTFFTPSLPDAVVTAPKQMERLDRGLVALRIDSSSVYVGWRLFGTDDSTIGFNVYRNGVKLNSTPIVHSTNYVDSTAVNGVYTVKAVLHGAEQRASRQVNIWSQGYWNIPLVKPDGGTTPDGVAYTYTANDCSVGDVDGDGEYEIILKWDPTNSKDNSQSGYTGNVYLDAYKLNGTRLWRIDLGRNIRAGAHYTQFMVYDLDGDGKAEVACKTADGTVDGTGVVIGDANADYRNTSGYILSGPEFLTVFNGLTGKAMATTDYLPARGSVAAWGDTYGNRVDRFIAAVAYVDGTCPSLIMGRGYYTRLVRAAWDWRNGQLTLRWIFDSDSTNNGAWAGDGNHQMTVGDADGDGKQEIFNGSSSVNDNGRGFWDNGMGHGDAMHMSDMDPDRPGLEIWQCYEDPAGNGLVGAALVDAKTGDRIFTVAEPSADVGRALAADIDPRYKGYEVWAARGNLYTVKGVQIGTTKPSMNFAIWWDGDLSRELLDGTAIQKWQYLTSTRTNLLAPDGVASNNSTKATPCLSADILGDWREEVIFRSANDTSLRIYSTNIPTEYRFYTLMHDPQYRAAIAWQNSAYNQPPHPGFYLGTDMDAPPAANIAYVTDTIPPVVLPKNVTVVLHNGTASVTADEIDNGSYDAFEIDSLTLSKTTFGCTDIGDNPVILTVTDKNGNIATANAVVTVVGGVPQKPAVRLSRTVTAYTGKDSATIVLGYGAQQLTLTAAAAADSISSTWQWSPAAGLSRPDSAVTVFTPTEAGDYVFAVEASNKYGCVSVSDIATIHVLDARCGNRNEKVVVCHKGNDLCVAPAAVAALLAHGDSLGSCSCTVPVKGNNHPNSLSVFPNPVHGTATVSVKLGNTGRYVVELYDIRGKLVRVLANSNNTVPDSQYSYALPAGQLTIGLYFVKLTTTSGILTQPVIVL